MPRAMRLAEARGEACWRHARGAAHLLDGPEGALEFDQVVALAEGPAGARSESEVGQLQHLPICEQRGGGVRARDAGLRRRRGGAAQAGMRGDAYRAASGGWKERAANRAHSFRGGAVEGGRINGRREARGRGGGRTE
eukprot:6680429-Prymnesium_polylepis.2